MRRLSMLYVWTPALSSRGGSANSEALKLGCSFLEKRVKNYTHRTCKHAKTTLATRSVCKCQANSTRCFAHVFWGWVSSDIVKYLKIFTLWYCSWREFLLTHRLGMVVIMTSRRRCRSNTTNSTTRWRSDCRCYSLGHRQMKTHDNKWL